MVPLGVVRVVRWRVMRRHPCWVVAGKRLRERAGGADKGPGSGGVGVGGAAGGDAGSAAAECPLVPVRGKTVVIVRNIECVVVACTVMRPRCVCARAPPSLDRG